MLHEEANRQLLENLDAASKRAQAALMPSKLDVIAIVLNLRGLIVNQAEEIKRLNDEVRYLQGWRKLPDKSKGEPAVEIRAGALQG